MPQSGSRAVQPPRYHHQSRQLPRSMGQKKVAPTLQGYFNRCSPHGGRDCDSCPIPLASTRPKPNLTRTVGSLYLRGPSAALPRACLSHPISPVAHPPLHLPVSLSGVAQPYASGHRREVPPPPGQNRLRERGQHGRNECNHRRVRGPLTLAINPKQTHQYHCVLLRSTAA